MKDSYTLISADESSCQSPRLSSSSGSAQSKPVSIAASLSPFENCIDLGLYTSCDIHKLSDQQRIWLLKNSFHPTESYKFPTKEEYNKSRSFQHTWIKQYSWLSYSQSLNGGFCIKSFLFPKNRSLYAQLFTQPMTCSTRAKTTLQKHNLQLTHKMAMDDSMAVMGQMECSHLSIQ